MNAGSLSWVFLCHSTNKRWLELLVLNVLIMRLERGAPFELFVRSRACEQNDRQGLSFFPGLQEIQCVSTRLRRTQYKPLYMHVSRIFLLHNFHFFFLHHVTLLTYIRTLTHPPTQTSSVIKFPMLSSMPASVVTPTPVSLARPAARRAW